MRTELSSRRVLSCVDRSAKFEGMVTTDTRRCSRASELAGLLELGLVFRKAWCPALLSTCVLLGGTLWPTALRGGDRMMSGAAAATRGTKQETDVAQRVHKTIGRIRGRLARLGRSKDPELRRVSEQVEAIIRRSDYRIVVPRDTSSLQRVLARERDGAIVVNRDYFPRLRDDEAEALIFHEFTHMLPAQGRRTSVSRGIDHRLPASPAGKRAAMLAPTEAGRQLRRDYKRLLALEARNELESYLWQFAYMTHQARERGFGTLQDYVQELARSTRLPTQAAVYREWLTAMRNGRIRERLVIGHVLHLAGPGEWPLLRALAVDEGVNGASQDAMEGWLLSWAMDPAYRELPESSPWWRDWRVWVGAGMSCLFGLALLRRRAR